MIRAAVVAIATALLALFPPIQSGPKPLPLQSYTFDALRQRVYQKTDIKFTRKLKNDIWEFYFYSGSKKVTGVASSNDLTKPVIILLHGFASQEEYYPGFGTERIAAYLAKNGFTTLAPDFLGYGGSDKPSLDVFEERFETYTTILDLMASVKPAGLWGHSNGGQIALSVAAISGTKIPVALWNPVSKPFPYNILYYTDSFEDNGRALRANLAKFEADYDAEKYSTPNYLGWIKAPIILQQGELDPWVPKAWSDELNEKLKMKNVKYVVYPGADHNLMPGWEKAAADALNFFNAQTER